MKKEEAAIEIAKHKNDGDLIIPVLKVDIFDVKIDITKQVTDLILKYNPQFKNVVWLGEDKQ